VSTRNLLLLCCIALAGCPSSQPKATTPTPDPVTPAPTSTAAAPVKDPHFVLKTSIRPPFPEGTERAEFAMGCFWGAEKRFWSLPGVTTTAVGYTGGNVPDPTYEQVCTHTTEHAETVLVVYDPKKTSYEALLKAFWEGHDPTQGDRQGGDVGTQYRSMIFTFSEAQKKAAEESRAAFQKELTKAGYGAITTRIEPAGDFYYAEDYHQQYLAKNPNGYCGHGGTGVSCPVGVLK
jgi:peptide-methionine (S)-S-oxide reductase